MNELHNHVAPPAVLLLGRNHLFCSYEANSLVQPLRKLCCCVRQYRRAAACCLITLLLRFLPLLMLGLLLLGLLLLLGR
jgi:hypothetical protein